MEQKKYILREKTRTQLQYLRKETKLTIEEVSLMIGKSKDWLGQIERGKLQGIKKEDLIKLLLIYTDYTKEELIYDGIVENFIKTGIAFSDKPEAYNWHEEVRWLTDRFFFYLDESTSDEDLYSRLADIHSLERCLEHFPGAMVLYFEHFKTILKILEGYKTLKGDQQILRFTRLMNKISTILTEELDNIPNQTKKSDNQKNSIL